MSGKSFKVSDNLKFWVLEQKLPTKLKEILNVDDPHSKKELSEKEISDLLSIVELLGIDVSEKNKEDEEYKSELVDEILKSEEDAAKYRANVWLFENQMDAINKSCELIDDLLPDLNDPESIDQAIEQVSKTYTLQEQEIIETKMNLRGVSWLKVFLLSRKQA